MVNTSLEAIEDAVQNVQNKHQVDRNLEAIRKLINLEFKANCKYVSVINNDNSNYFFGAHVFPTEKELYKISQKIVDNKPKVKFEECSEFVIELDSKLLYELGATPKEITAVILHEIGHKIFSTECQVRAKAILFTAGVGIGAGVAGLIFKLFNPIKFMLYTVIMVAFDSSFAYLHRLQTEIEADSFAVKCGYAVPLNSILNKIEHGHVKIYNDDKEILKPIADWTIMQSVNFSVRRQSILKDLQKQLKNEESPQIRKVLVTQIQNVKSSKGNSFIVPLKESMKEEALNESVKTFFEIYKKGFSNLEIDELFVELERMEDNDDRLYFVQRVHSDITAVDTMIQDLQDMPKSEFAKKYKGGSRVKLAELQNYKSQLMELLKQGRTRKLKDNNFKFIVAYPDGYEG